MTSLDRDQILAARDRIRLLGKTSKAQEAAVIAQCLGYPLEVVRAVLESEKETA